MDERDLQAWIREHRVCWDLSPHYEMCQRKRIQVGYDFTLSARSPDAFRSGQDGLVSRRDYEALREVAEAVLPSDGSTSRCELGPFAASVRLRPETQWTPEVELNLSVLHRDRVLEVVDEDERRCVAGIQEKLRGLGLHLRTWSEPAPTSPGGSPGGPPGP